MRPAGIIGRGRVIYKPPAVRPDLAWRSIVAEAVYSKITVV